MDIVEKVGVTWINSRLDFYEDYIEKLFRPTGELLAEAPTRVAQMQAEALLLWMAREDIEHMKVSSAEHEQVREAYDHDSNQDCWLTAYSFLSLFLEDLTLLDLYGCEAAQIVP